MLKKWIWPFPLFKTKAMDTAIENLLAVTAKSTKRDFAWNMIMWAAYKTTIRVKTSLEKMSSVAGSMEFFANARFYGIHRYLY